LRILLYSKATEKSRGEIVLCNLSRNRRRFSYDGFYALFSAAFTGKICTLNEQGSGSRFTQKQNIAGIEIEYITNGTPPGHLEFDWLSAKNGRFRIQ
jgi:hypothetical protein